MRSNSRTTLCGYSCLETTLSMIVGQFTAVFWSSPSSEQPFLLPLSPLINETIAISFLLVFLFGLLWLYLVSKVLLVLLGSKIETYTCTCKLTFKNQNNGSNTDQESRGKKLFLWHSDEVHHNKNHCRVPKYHYSNQHIYNQVWHITVQVVCWNKVTYHKVHHSPNKAK